MWLYKGKEGKMLYVTKTLKSLVIHSISLNGVKHFKDENPDRKFNLVPFVYLKLLKLFFFFLHLDGFGLSVPPFDETP